MKRTRADFDRLIAELRLDYVQLDDLMLANAKADERIRLGANDGLDYAALGYTIHNVYGLIENACLRIAKFFENNISDDAWHRDLLRRMLLDIPRMRPAFFTPEAYTLIDELRGFRHVFRNAYSRSLDPERILLLQKKMPVTAQHFKAAVDSYVEFLERFREEIEE